MKLFSSVNEPQVVGILRAGGIGVIRTDTLYGVIACASNEHAVQRVYDLKERAEHKSPIVLVHDISDVYDPVSQSTSTLLDEAWPGPVSVIIPSQNAPLWIRRDNQSVAYRQPNSESLLQLLAQTGPLIAPSANPEGMKPAMNTAEAQAYFGENVDFYVDSGQVTDAAPSKLIRVNQDGTSERLR